MGDPKKSRKRSSRPRNPWQRNLLKDELNLLGRYGLRNKREVHRAATELSRIRNQARQLLAAPTEIRVSRELILLNSLTNKGIVSDGSTLDDILALNVSNILDRRLQTVVLRKQLARTPHQSRQLITHGHIIINDRKITIPSYVVNQNEEGKIRSMVKIEIDKPEISKDENIKESSNIEEEKTNEEKKVTVQNIISNKQETKSKTKESTKNE